MSTTSQMLEKKWHELYIDEHGLAPLTVAAAEAAGSWRKLFKSKTLKLREVLTKHDRRWKAVPVC